VGISIYVWCSTTVKRTRKKREFPPHGKVLLGGDCQKRNHEKHLLSELFFLSNKFLDLKSCHTATTGACNSLSVSFILNITSGVDTFHRGLCGSWNGDDVAVGVSLHLCADQRGRGFVSWGCRSELGQRSIGRETYQ
jgi:hypothetical protein